ncbi:MAG: hypothetical protein DWI11_04490 [Planctomycetota bacterium]|nr:MAG: hypothetical protein DWI11_04490 [Planctomycetota bacterium]
MWKRPPEPLCKELGLTPGEFGLRLFSSLLVFGVSAASEELAAAATETSDQVTLITTTLGVFRIAA